MYRLNLNYNSFSLGQIYNAFNFVIRVTTITLGNIFWIGMAMAQNHYFLVDVLNILSKQMWLACSKLWPNCHNTSVLETFCEVYIHVLLVLDYAVNIVDHSVDFFYQILQSWSWLFFLFFLRAVKLHKVLYSPFVSITLHPNFIFQYNHI